MGDRKASDFTPISNAMLDAGAKAAVKFCNDLSLTDTAYDLACAVIKAAMEAQMEAEQEMTEDPPNEMAFRAAAMHGLPAITVGKGDDSEPRQTWVRAERYEAMVEALDWYGRGCGVAQTLEEAARDDFGAGSASSEFYNDCGKRAREVLDTL